MLATPHERLPLTSGALSSPGSGMQAQSLRGLGEDMDSSFSTLV